MTLGVNSESALQAYNKRKGQLERWSQSDTEKESTEIKNRPKRVKFNDKCIFQAACASNDKLQVARMIRDGYNINDVDDDGITALHQVKTQTYSYYTKHFANLRTWTLVCSCKLIKKLKCSSKDSQSLLTCNYKSTCCKLKIQNQLSPNKESIENQFILTKYCNES